MACRVISKQGRFQVAFFRNALKDLKIASRELPIHVAAREAAVVVGGLDNEPALMPLAQDVGFTCLVKFDGYASPPPHKEAEVPPDPRPTIREPKEADAQSSAVQVPSPEIEQPTGRSLKVKDPEEHPRDEPHQRIRLTFLP